MSTDKKDISNMTSEELLNEINKNIIQSSKITKDIANIRASLASSSDKYQPEELVKPLEYEDDEYDDFEQDYYLEIVNKYMALPEDYSREELLEILPSPYDYDFKDVLYRLIAESQKEINEMLKMKMGDTSLNEEEIKECDRSIEHEKSKISILKERLVEKENRIDENCDNVILFMKSNAGKIKIFDDFDQIEDNTYSVFLDLIKSIEDGSFKRVKRLNGDHLAGLLEVKDYQSRVTFKRLKENIYVIIQAFTKKVYSSSKYRESMVGRYREFLGKEDSFLRDVEKPEFIEENNKIKEELYQRLSLEKKTSKGVTK